jgi:hypothetical protein
VCVRVVVVMMLVAVLCRGSGEGGGDGVCGGVAVCVW